MRAVSSIHDRRLSGLPSRARFAPLSPPPNKVVVAFLPHRLPTRPQSEGLRLLANEIGPHAGRSALSQPFPLRRLPRSHSHLHPSTRRSIPCMSSLILEPWIHLPLEQPSYLHCLPFGLSRSVARSPQLTHLVPFGAGRTILLSVGRQLPTVRSQSHTHYLPL